jgi:hypothetical protein
MLFREFVGYFGVIHSQYHANLYLSVIAYQADLACSKYKSRWFCSNKGVEKIKNMNKKNMQTGI